MAASKFLRYVGGVVTEVFGKQTSSGVADAGAIVALDDSGRIDESMMPVGLGADTANVEASETLAAGDWVNLWDDAGAFKVRKADATTPGKAVHGFVLSSAPANASATVYFEGTNTQVSGMTPGDVFLATTAGAGSTTPPTGSGNVVQRLGVAVSATAVSFERGEPIKLA